LGQALREEAAASAVGQPPAPTGPAGLILVDCLTLWVSNCLWPPDAQDPDYTSWRRQRDDFLAALAECNAETIIVTNEVGTGIVPNNNAARVFRDEQGWLNQAVAAACDEVFFVTAGLPLCLKPSPTGPGHITARPR
jgi:adenosylcobinamide kinase/adenosylcobinamide-phosphate guanylyltransferase